MKFWIFDDKVSTQYFQLSTIRIPNTIDGSGGKRKIDLMNNASTNINESRVRIRELNPCRFSATNFHDKFRDCIVRKMLSVTVDSHSE